MKDSADIIDFPFGREMRRVHFLDSVELELFEIDGTDVEKAWYSASDERRFKQETMNEVVQFRLMSQRGGGEEADNEHPICPSGLERVIPQAIWQRSIAAKRSIVHAVMAEQSRQVASLQDDKEARIAFVSIHHSNWSIQHAKEIGSYHAISAQEEMI
mmetsp:Transcript_11916/g.20701  ORF Transcript_11916/g.20701 Transcript_11916/m.20701 type:complete len:158 (+) Transcript_11916:145-618(+)|eukprot:CAMPEP_0183704156 /NCGR_PEP_ID=MMETSP0737-20130205/1591_1 /TAXON_ID=385413 /ORGANISM="Thalassiosira miniscula, Strain CCMP1093" /LENGTH=157 /DNA_ID=CAMNT_0025930977 /DNA_START=118 /DNA_END=591 /DNA_ORIENTATION=-